MSAQEITPLDVKSDVADHARQAGGAAESGMPCASRAAPPSGKWIATGVGGALLLMSGLVAFWIGTIGTRPSLLREGLVVDADQLDFGDAWENQSIRRVLSVRNPTSSAIHVRAFLCSSAAMTVEPASVDVPPAQAVRISVNIDLASMCGLPSAKATEQATFSITPLIAGHSPRVVTWKVGLRVRKPFSVEAHTLHFSTPVVHGVTPPVRKTHVRAHYPLRSLSVACDTTCARARLVHRADNTDGYDLEVEPSNRLPCGPFAIPISVKGVTQQGAYEFAQHLVATGSTEEDVWPAPDRVDSGVTALGEVIRHTVVLRSSTSQAFTLEGIEGGQNVHVEPAHGASTQQAFMVTQQATRLGRQTNKLVFLVRLRGRALIQVPFELSYYWVSTRQTRD